MPSLYSSILTVIIGLVGYQWYSFRRVRSKIDHIPTVGSDSFGWAWLSAWRHLTDGLGLMKEGYAKYPGGVFKFPTFNTESGWFIIVNSRDMIDELRRAPLDVLSFAQGTEDSLETPIILGPRHSSEVDYHANVVRNPLTRAIGPRFSDVYEEVVDSCKEYLPAMNDWVPVKFHEASVHTICRVSNRLLVGLPTCREPEYRKIQEEWTINLVIGANILHLFPSILRPAVSYLMSRLSASTKKVEKFLQPVVAERLEKEAKYGPNWDGKPNDSISWLLETAPPGFRTVEDITARIMLINFAAIHTTSLTLTNTLFDLAARQEYVKPLREEMEDAVSTHGWTKEAMGKMRKTDSFIKESSRLGGLIFTSVVRKATKDFAFSNGITIPAGYTVAAASAAIHADNSIYKDAEKFDGFRFLDTEPRDDDAKPSGIGHLKTQFTTLDPTYLFFGIGRNSCPGRFFVVNEIKAVLAHILLNYDIKLPGDSTVVPPGKFFFGGRSPDPTAEVLFRKKTQA